MSSSQNIAVFCLLIVFLTISFQANAQSYQENPRPNIIWLMAEDISIDLETYGVKGIETPNLNKLADQGIKYNNVFSTNPICSPNRSAMMVGVHQNVINAQHHRSNRDRVLPDPYKPITYWLREAGYTNILGHHSVRGKGRKIDVNFKYENLGLYDGKSSFGLFDKLDTLSVNEQPFFAQIQLNVTHRGDWWQEIRNQSSNPVDPDSIELPPYIADHPIIRQDWATYYDQIEYMDHEVGVIMQELEEMGIGDNTVIVFFGDNGRSNIRGKGYLYDAGLRVPLIVRWPKKLKGGEISDQVISTTDIAASTLSLAGVDLPDYLTGIPFINKKSNREAVYSSRDLWDEILDRSRSISTSRFKYIRNDMPLVPFDAEQAYLEFYRPAVHIMRLLYHQVKLNSLQERFFTAVKPKEELYDLENDPYETINLVNNAKYSDQLKQMRHSLNEWESTLPDSSPSDHDLIVPGAVDLLEWIKYEYPNLYLNLLRGEDIGFQELSRKYESKILN